MASITITYNPKAGGRAKVTVGAGPNAARRRTLHRGGFIFNEGATVGVYNPGHAAADLASLFTSLHSDALTLTTSTTGYYADGSE